MPVVQTGRVGPRKMQMRIRKLKPFDNFAFHGIRVFFTNQGLKETVLEIGPEFFLEITLHRPKGFFRNFNIRGPKLFSTRFSIGRGKGGDI